VGPADTASCLHYDNPHNILSQVIGFKYVRLYEPALAPRLYPRPGAMCNTSAVNVAAPDASAHPAFLGAPFLECVIGPGDALYIPPGWWHYIVALSPSWSVSCWWGATY
jgi:lysine-specific demethylase 8